MPRLPPNARSRARASRTSTYLDPLETSENPRRPQTRAQAQLHARHAFTRDRTISALEGDGSIDLSKRADRLDGCCAFPQVHVSDAGKPLLSLQCCKDRLCPRCQVHRGRKAAVKIAVFAQAMNAPRFITLTMKHRLASLAQELARAAAAFKKLRSTKVWKRNVTGGVYAVQVTRNPQTSLWHVHYHMLVDGVFFPQKQLSALWLEVTGDSHIVDIQAVVDRASTARYISSYVTKPNAVGAWPDSAICAYAIAMAGRRTLHTFGSLHAQAVDPLPDDHECKSVESLGSIARIQRWADRGHVPAANAIELLSRLGPTWRSATGLPDLPPNQPTVPVEPWEVEKAVDTLKTLVNLDETREFPARKNLPDLPPPPQKPPLQLFAGQAHHR